LLYVKNLIPQIAHQHREFAKICGINLTTLAAKSPKNSYNTVTLMISMLISLPPRRYFMKFNLLQTLQASFDAVNAVPPAKSQNQRRLLITMPICAPIFGNSFRYLS